MATHPEEESPYAPPQSQVVEIAADGKPKRIAQYMAICLFSAFAIPLSFPIYFGMVSSSWGRVLYVLAWLAVPVAWLVEPRRGSPGGWRQLTVRRILVAAAVYYLGTVLAIVLLLVAIVVFMKP